MSDSDGTKASDVLDRALQQAVSVKSDSDEAIRWMTVAQMASDLMDNGH